MYHWSNVMCISYLSRSHFAWHIFIFCNRKKKMKRRKNIIYSSFFLSLSIFAHSAEIVHTKHLPTTPHSHCDSKRIVLVHFLYFTCSFRLLLFLSLLLIISSYRKERKKVWNRERFFFFFLSPPSSPSNYITFRWKEKKKNEKCFLKGASKCYWYSSREYR